MIRTIILDLGKVIIPFDFKRSYDRMSSLSGRDASEIAERLRGNDLFTRFESGAIEPSDFVSQISGMFDLKCSYDEFCEVWSSIFLPEPLLSESFIQALHRRYRMVLLSNTNAIHFQMLEKTYPILENFDQYVLSHRVGALKPSPKIYEAAVRAAQCRPEECFFTDDIAEYAEGARRYGIDAVQFESPEQLETELKKRGVEW